MESSPKGPAFRTRRTAEPRTDLALCLRRVPYGNSSLVAELLTEQHGRIGCLARGAYRPSSRYFGVLDGFHRLEITWRPAQAGGLGVLLAGDRERSRRGITADLDRYRSASMALELAELISRPGQSETRLFAGLDRLLERLDQGAPAAAELLAFDLNCLADLGLAPALLRCGACGRRAPKASSPQELADFDPAAGGRLCPDCARGSTANPRVPAALLESLAALAKKPDSGTAATEGATGRELIDRFLEYHLERPPRSRARSR